MGDVMVFGAGWMGSRLARDLGAGLTSADITQLSAIEAELDVARPAVVVNAAGKTGRPNVDWCESNREVTTRVNVVGAVLLAEACARRGIHLVHLASGCVFYGDSPSPGGWTEEDHANPVSHYARSKYAADLVLSGSPHVAVVRLRMPIDDTPHPRNLITKLAGYPWIADVTNSVTVVEDFVEVVRALVERRASGIFHATNPEPIRYADLLVWYRELVDPAHRATLIPEDEILARGLIQRRRSACVLASRRLGELGITMRPAPEAVRAALTRYGRVFRGG